MSNRNRPRPGQRPAASGQQRAEARPAPSAQYQQDGPYSVRPGDGSQADAIGHEATGERYVWYHAGKRFELLNNFELPYQQCEDALEASMQNRSRPLLRLILGEAQWKTFCQLPATTGEVGQCLAEWSKWNGITGPESSASPSS